MKTGIELIAQERKEQIEKHGRTIFSDTDVNRSEQLRLGAIRLIVDSYDRECLNPNDWNIKAWQKMAAKDYKERLIIAGALIAAEIDRLQYVEKPDCLHNQYCDKQTINMKCDSQSGCNFQG